MSSETGQRALEAQGPSNQNIAPAAKATTAGGRSNSPHSVDGGGGRGGDEKGDATRPTQQQKTTATTAPPGLQDKNDLVESMRGNAINRSKQLID